MKRNLFLITLSLFSISIFSQQIVENQIDKFTKNKVIQVNASSSKNWSTSDAVTKGMFKNVFVSFRKVNQTNYLQLGVSANGYILCFSEDKEAILLFSDDSTLKLKNLDTNCDHNLVAGKFILSDENLELLKTKELQGIRIYFSEGYSDYEIRKNKKAVIQKTAELFHSTITNE